MKKPLRILFLCTGNSCRSQMAEGFCNALPGNPLQAVSCGIERHGLNPNAVRVMQEVGVDISGHESKTLDDIDTDVLDFVITVCGHANETCPLFPGPVQVIHQPSDDPPRLAHAAASEAEALNHYRRVRDEIRDYVATLPQSLGT